MPTDWKNLYLRPLTKGYNVSLPPDALPEGASPHIENFIFERGRLEIDNGYAVRGQALVGTPRLIYQFQKKNGVTEILLITNLTMYKWASVGWEYISNGNETTTTAERGEGTSNIPVVDKSGFDDGEFL